MLGTNYDKHTYIHKTNKTNKRNWLLSLLILLLFFFFTLKLKLCITHKRECLLSVMFKLLINGSDRMNFSRANNRYFCGTSAQSTEPFLVWWRKTQYFHKNVCGCETINLWAGIIFAFKAILDQTTMSKVPPFWIATHTHIEFEHCAHFPRKIYTIAWIPIIFPPRKAKRKTFIVDIYFCNEIVFVRTIRVRRGEEAFNC